MDEALIAVPLIGWCILLAICGLVLVRRAAPLHELEANHQVGNIIFSVVGTAYAVLLSFVVFLVWAQFNDANEASQQEASRMGALFWIAQGLPDADRLAMQRGVRDYINVVIDEEWPLMARGEASETAWTRHDQLWAALYQIQPSGDRQLAIFAAALDEMRASDAARQERLVTAGDRVPGMLWALLTCGGVALVLTSYLFATKRLLPQAVMTAVLTGLITFVLVLIAMFNQPFSGGIRVQPSGFQSVLDLTNAKLGN